MNTISKEKIDIALKKIQKNSIMNIIPEYEEYGHYEDLEYSEYFNNYINDVNENY